MGRALYKTTIVVWTEYDTEHLDIECLGQQAMDGEAHNSKFSCEYIEKPEDDSDWDDSEFFKEEDQNET